MDHRDPRIDAYIANAAPFAQPILARLRDAVHEACPGVEETMKWGMPYFTHAGAMLCGMAAFKQHASFGFWKHEDVMGEGVPRDGMGSFGRMSKLADVPPKKTLLPLIRKAAALNTVPKSERTPRKAAAARPQLPVPDDFAAALARTPKARKVFEAFSPSQRRDYVEWIVEAKREDTRARRLAQAIEWLAEGKTRNWKYETR